MGLHLRRSMLAMLVTAVALGVAGAFAYAQVTGDSVIKACAQKISGQLRLDSGDGCRPAEGAIQWNAAGLQGIQGPQGIQGVQGPPGPTHTDERTFARSLGDPTTWLPVISGTWPSIRPSMTHVLTVHLDPGNYAVTAQVIAGNYDGTGVIVCLLGNSTAGFAVMQSAVGSGPGFAVQQTVGAQSVFPMPTGGDIDLSCFNAPPNDPAGHPSIGLADVMSTKIDTYTAS